MIELNPMPGGIRIDYPAGDTFKFTLKAPKRFKDSTVVRFEISRSGGMPFVSKEYTPNGNRVDISLNDTESQMLLLARSHMYKILFVSGNNTARVVSGNIKIK
ncbi:MAG: hypothetical protein IJ454_03060 [Clostridia bacterium]|nr:hypothetical protein [Clostridia bacterium]